MLLVPRILNLEIILNVLLFFFFPVEGFWLSRKMLREANKDI